MIWRSAWRQAYDDMKAERDRLLVLVEKLADHGVRMERKASGLPERIPEPKQRAPSLLEHPEIVQACKAWGDEAARLRDAERQLSNGVPPSVVLASLTPDEEGG